MRLRIQTQQPLPELKAWFVPRITNTTSSTILELKRALCHIQPLQHENLQSEHIRLLLDGFELLDDLAYDEVLRDGDLVFIQLSHEPRVNVRGERNRKTVEVPAERALKKRKKSPDVEVTGRGQIKRRRRESSSESTTSSLSSGTTSQSEDDSSSTSSTTSSSSSNESSSHSPPVTVRVNNDRAEKTRLLTRKKTGKLPGPKTFSPPVPPGYGKPSTQSRNRRRRLKREHERQAKTAEQAPPKGMSAANTTILGLGPSEKVHSTLHFVPREEEYGDDNEQAAPGPSGYGFGVGSQNRNASIAGTAFNNGNGEVMMVSLRNKNKKKNFRQTMAPPAVRKIVFDESGEGHLSSSTPTLKSNSGRGIILESGPVEIVVGEVANVASALRERVVPPSELAAQRLLPSNMFVTSVDFGQKSKKKRRPGNKYGEDQVGAELQYVKSYADREDNEWYEDADVHLSYREEEGTREGADAAVVEDSQPHFDWKLAEAGWEDFSPIQTLDQLYKGVLVCWQGLAINPQTFTPEQLLGVGRVEKTEGFSITIRQLLRPGTETAAAFGIGDESGEGEEEDYSWDDIACLGWKILSV